MIELKTTCDIVTMLLIAGGVGLIGGVGAALLEIRKRGEGSTANTVGSFLSCVFLGGVAAVAILYFFPPAEQILVTDAGPDPALSTEYDLTKLVALSLIVGSAGPAFLAILHTRTLAVADAKQTTTATRATASEVISGVAGQAATLARASVASSAPQIQEALQAAGSPPLSSSQVDQVVGQLADQAEATVADKLASHVASAQKKVVEAAAPEARPKSG